MNKEDSFYMDTLEKTQPETFDFINHLSEQCHSELSFASHEINNQLSFIRSSYQLISKKHPETKDFPFWAELGDAVNHIISYMKRTDLYRYSFKYVPAKLNLTEFLYSLPDIFDEQFPNRANAFQFDIDTRNIFICADSKRLLSAFSELLANAAEADTSCSSIQIHSHVNACGHTVTVSVTGKGSLSEINPNEMQTNPLIDADAPLTAQLSTPFFSTKENHAGLGLSIVAQVCHTHHAGFELYSRNGFTTAGITFPILAMGDMRNTI